MTAGTEFLNIGLELRCQCGLDDLRSCLEPPIFVLHRTAQEVSFELLKMHRSFVEALLNVTDFIHFFAPNARLLWDRCESRKINIGIQTGHSPYAKELTISDLIVSRLAAARCEIAFTIYAPITPKTAIGTNESDPSP